MLNEIKIFVRAVELRSISAAARSLRLSAAAASHRILQLEDQLGARLKTLERSTGAGLGKPGQHRRPISLTKEE